MKPLVSIITPVYNAQDYLEETILSVLNQTYKNWELILIDDCSTDKSYEIIEKYLKEDKRIRYLKNEKNSGPAITRNNGIENSKGDYIAFLDSDDLWSEDKLEKQIYFMINNNIFMCHGDYEMMDENGKYLKKIKTKKELDYFTLLKENQIKTSFLVLDQRKIKDIYFPNIRHEDFACFLDILKKYKIKSIKLDKVLGKYRVINKSLSGNKLKSAVWTWNIYRKYEKLDLVRSFYYFINYSLKGLKKYRIWSKNEKNIIG